MIIHGSSEDSELEDMEESGEDVGGIMPRRRTKELKDLSNIESNLESIEFIASVASLHPNHVRSLHQYFSRFRWQQLIFQRLEPAKTWSYRLWPISLIYYAKVRTIAHTTPNNARRLKK